MAKSPDIPNNIQKVYRRFERWRSAHTGRLPIPERLWAAAVELAREHGVFHTAQALHLEYSKLKGMVGSASPVAKGRVAKAQGSSAASRAVHGTADVCGTDGVTSGRCVGVPDRVGRAAWQDTHSVERDDRAGPGWAEPGVLGIQVIQIVPQMKILVAIEAVDGRKGIDSLARLCQEKLQEDPFSGCLFVFAAGGERRFAFWPMTAKGSGWRRSGCRRGGLCGGRVGRSQLEGCRPIKCSCYWRRVTRRRQRRRCGGG